MLMLEANTFRKNKINLADYDYQRDIKNRLLMAGFSSEHLLVLEELLYSNVKTAISQIAENVDMSKEEVTPLLKDLVHTELFEIQGDLISINKEHRKYFEAQIVKFEEDFTPGMDFLQNLLKKVPIHVLPTWYPIPRTSDNIFDSLIEKYLATPQSFQRYLVELSFSDPTLSQVVQEVLNSKDFKLPTASLKKSLGMSDEEFEEIALQLEFNFVCCITYEKVGNGWVSYLTPFHEWHEYLCFIRDNKPKSIEAHEISRMRPKDFSFIEDLTNILLLTKKSPLPLTLQIDERWHLDKSAYKAVEQALGDCNSTNENMQFFDDYTSRIVQKILFLKLARVEKSSLIYFEGSSDWLNLSIENRALTSYKHTIANPDLTIFSQELSTERNIKEIEKSTATILHLGWVSFESFVQGMIAPLSEEGKVSLKKTGKNWRYALPQYSDIERKLIETALLGWLFEAGITAVGYKQEQPCFTLTAFGVKLFS